MTKSDDGLLRFAVSGEPLVSIIFDGLNKSFRLNGDTDVVIAVPERWSVRSSAVSSRIEHYNKDITLSYSHLRLAKRSPWFIISNGRFATQIDNELLGNLLTSIDADVVAVNVVPKLLAHHEKVLLTAQGRIAGFRRLYSDSAELAPVPADWPHHILIKNDALGRILADRTLPGVFSKLINICSSNSLVVRSINIGGTILDLDTEKGLLGFVAAGLNSSAFGHRIPSNGSRKKIASKDSVRISDTARLFGKVLFGQNVSIGQNAIVAGPTIIGDDVKIAQGAVIRASIIGHGVSVPRNHIIQNRVFINGRQLQKQTKQTETNGKPVTTNGRAIYRNCCADNFRTWPKLSYAGCLKRVADIITAVMVLILFAPVFPIIALIIKLTSPGPVFFKDMRQGLHGKAFNCLKFRTMLVGADKMQDKLRVLNQTDGPQFKMADDPRQNAVGSFLRDTYIDEVPQFLNVLLGQMSLVGPRPSPESENTLCPYWRDARLSVRPGITGLWQVFRTRQPMKDFQEWIHYDIKYVKNLSLKLDLWICWQTTKKLVRDFISQF